MNIEMLRNALQSIDTSLWKEQPYAGTKRSNVRWLPIMRTKTDGAFLGLSEEGLWAVETGRGIVILVNVELFLPLLPLLEQPRESFVEAFRKAISDLSLPVAVSNTFPQEKLILFALRFGSAYWKELALDWLDGFPISREIAATLSAVACQQWPQHFRHRVRRILGEC